MSIFLFSSSFYYFLGSTICAYIWEVTRQKWGVNLRPKDKLMVQTVQVILEEINLNCFC